MGRSRESFRRHMVGELWQRTGENLGGHNPMVVCGAGAAERKSGRLVRGERWNALAWHRWRRVEPVRWNAIHELLLEGWIALRSDSRPGLRRFGHFVDWEHWRRAQRIQGGSLYRVLARARSAGSHRAGSPSGRRRFDLGGHGPRTVSAAGRPAVRI